MQNTTYYNLNIVEGTDIVNPMSVDNPNYQTIDATMYANECNSIGSATELKTGTVHALTRVKANQNVFRFRATARYVAGDTFTVDGNVVTAQLPDGSALADGAYIIGSDVLCALVGTQLTLYVSINNGEQIMYDQNTSVNQKIDSLDATTLEYSSGTSIKTKIDSVEASMTWKEVGVINNTTTQNIPDNAKEILLIVMNTALGTSFGSVVVPIVNTPFAIFIPYENASSLMINRSGLTLSFADTSITTRVVRMLYR